MQEKVKSFFTTYQIEIYVFIIAAAVRLIAVFLLQHYTEPWGYLFPINGNDARGYVQIAENILNHGIFSRSSEVPFLPDTLRTPGYPLFVGFFLLLHENVLVISIAQALLAAFTAVFVYRTSFILLKSSRLGIWTALLFSFDPLGIFLSGVLLSETLFTFLLTWSVYALIMRKVPWKTGVLLGIASLVRPVGLIFLPLFIVAEWFFEKEHPVRKAGIVVATFFVIVSPWLARNYVSFDSLQLTDISTRKLYSYDVPIFYAQRKGISESQARDELQKTLQNEVGIAHVRDMTLAHAPQIRTVSLSYISGHEVSFTVFYMFKSLPFFFTDGLRDVAREIHLVEGTFPNTTDAILSGRVLEWFKIFKNTTGEAVLFLVGFAFWGTVTICMLVGAGIAFLRNHPRRYELLFFLALVVTAGMLTGTVANYRLRHPVTPFMLIICIYGIYELASYISKHIYSYEK